MTSNAAPGRASGQPSLVASGPTSSLWLKLLRLSSLVTAAAILTTAALALFIGPSSTAGNRVLSVGFSGLLVMVFFGISLLIGHFVGRNNPSGAMGTFVAVYFIKVVFFAVALWLVGSPVWIESAWFIAGAVVAVVVWQVAEIFGFSRARLQIYADPVEETQNGH
ncbi:hypothetical protein ACQR35_05700 [Pseudarthrobacter sp. J1738]|uniref:hypothetical protein n=1 Tax=unclassified Pseudarthrobacter TaxID=2647000 RepID=UPI003D277197